MKFLTLAFLMAVLETSSFSLPPIAVQAGPVIMTPCSEVIYYDENDQRTCLTMDVATSMSVDAINAVIVAIERSTLKLASISPDLAKKFTEKNYNAIGDLTSNLVWKKRQIDFSSPSGENINFLAAYIAEVVDHNSAIDAKQTALQKLHRRLGEFYWSGRFEN